MKKKILILNYEYHPLWGWAWVVSKNYAEWLAKLWNEVTVITTWFNWESEIYQENNLKIIRLKSLRKKAFQSNPIEMLSWAFKSIIFLKKYLKTNTFDINIAFFSIPGWIVAKYLKEKYNLDYIISTHGHDIPGFYPEVMKKFHIMTNWYTKKIWKKSKKILVLTSDMKKLADDFWDEKKNILLPNWCNSDFFNSDFEKKKKKFHMVFIWRLVDQKDPFTCLEAIKLLREKNSDFKLNIIWDWPLKQRMQDFVLKNNLEKNVSFKWWITKKELRKYYQSAHIQICSSKVEAMSIAILESLYSWLYIISTPISGNNDMIKENKTWEFFEIWDYKKLAEKLIYWNKNYNKLKEQKKEIKNLKNKFNREKIINDLNNIIKNV